MSLPQRRMLGPHPSRSFAEILKGQVQLRDVIQSQLINTKEKEKNLIQREPGERQNLSRGLLEMNPRFSGAKVGDFPVGKADMRVVGGGVGREQCINVESDFGEQNLAEDRKRLPSSFSLNSKANENGKRSDLRRSCWIGSNFFIHQLWTFGK